MHPHFSDFRKRGFIVAEFFRLIGLLQPLYCAGKSRLDPGQIRAQQRPALPQKLRRGVLLSRRKRGHAPLFCAQDGIEKVAVLCKRFAFNRKAVFRQILPQRLPGALRLQNERIARIADPRRGLQNAHHQIAAHSGHNDRIRCARRDTLQAVGQEKLHVFGHAEARGVFAGLLQRLLAQVCCRDERADTLAQQVHGQISMIRADIGGAGPARDKFGAQQQPVGDRNLHRFTQKGGRRAALSFRFVTWPSRLPQKPR